MNDLEAGIIARKMFSSVSELETHAKKLEGMRISDINRLVGLLDESHRKHTKGVVARVIEQGFFGVPPNSRSGPDFEDLGVELKVSPLKFVRSRGLVTAKERNVIQMVDYHQVSEHPSWQENIHLRSKLSRVLFVFYLHENDKPALEWRVIHVFLWTPDQDEKCLIQKDYEVIRQRILKGEPNREGDNEFLATCPKHGGGYHAENPEGSKRSSLCSHPVMGMAQKRGFCIRNKPLMRLIAKSLGVETIRKGSSEGVSPDAFPHFGGVKLDAR